MEKKIVKGKIISYLKKHFIGHQEDIDSGVVRVTMVFNGYNSTPDNVIESCIYFFNDSMECRTYYTETGSRLCEVSRFKLDLMRLINFVNARLWPLTPNDGVGGKLYKPTYLYAPRLYITEDGYFDITMTTIIPYDFYEVAPLETIDFLTVSIPSLMNKLSYPVFSVLNGSMSSEQAIAYIEENILSK